MNDDDNLNAVRPSHYKNCSLECWDAMRLVYGKDAFMYFCLLNAFKYLWRCDYKNGKEDLRKAATYINEAEKICGGGDDIDELKRILKEKMG